MRGCQYASSQRRARAFGVRLSCVRASSNVRPRKRHRLRSHSKARHVPVRTSLRASGATHRQRQRYVKDDLHGVEIDCEE